MTTRDIVSKLKRELDEGITSEKQVVYLLAGIRKLIERDGAEEQYADLKFHCDWALHSSLDRGATKAILRKFDAAYGFLRQNVELHQLPAELRVEVDRILKMRSFKRELSRFLDAYGLPSLTQNRPDGWPHFLHLYTRVVEDTPLVVSLPPTENISRVVVHFDEAQVKHNVLFKVTWTVHDKNGQSGDIFVMNSFALKA